MDLAIQLAIIMVGKQALNNMMEVLMPWLIRMWRKIKRVRQLWQNIKRGRQKKKPEHSRRWQEDYKLPELAPTHLFSEYRETILQFGFVTIFVAAFPLAPLFALVNNIIEIRLDARKLVCSYRRPVAVRVRNIGIWCRILDFIGKLAVLTNGVIIAFSSDFIPRIFYRLTESPDGTLNGFVNFSLSHFNTSDFPSNAKPLLLQLPGDAELLRPEICRFLDHRNPPWLETKYSVNEVYWHLLVIRVAFVLVYEKVISMITTLIHWLIPDVPKNLAEQIRYENYVINELITVNELRRAKGFEDKYFGEGDTILCMNH